MTSTLLQKQLITLLLLPAVLLALLMQAGHCKDEHHREVQSSCHHTCKGNHAIDPSSQSAQLEHTEHTEQQAPHSHAPCKHECDLKGEPIVKVTFNLSIPHYSTQWEQPLDLLSILNLFSTQREAIQPAPIIVEALKAPFVASLRPMLI